MEKRQLMLLGAGMALAIAGIAVSAARRSLDAKEQQAVRAAEEAAYEQAERLPPPPRPDPGAVMHTEMVGAFELRLANGGGARLFTAEGHSVASLRGFQGARVLPGFKLFGAPAVELVGKDCQDPCNPSFFLVGSPGGRAKTVVEFRGIVKLEDLDGDGVPEAMVDHLVNRTAEIVTLPYVLEKERFVRGYSKFPEGVDRQITELGKSAERACGEAPEGECRDTLLALFLVHLFAEGGSLEELAHHLKIEPQIKAWASAEGLQKELGRELNEVAR